MNSSPKKIISFVVCLAIPLLVGGIGSIFTSASVDTWYTEINKPGFTPPGFVFPVAWTILYLLMGYASWLIYISERGIKRNRALIWYGFQLAFNMLWSYLFFTLQSPALALLEIHMLLVLILITTNKFWKVNQTAAWLMVPYILWVSFATVLNGTIWWMN